MQTMSFVQSEGDSTGPGEVLEGFLEGVGCELLLERWAETGWQKGHQLDPVRKPGSRSQVVIRCLTLRESPSSVSVLCREVKIMILHRVVMTFK